MRYAIVIVSDTCANNPAEDKVGPALAKACEDFNPTIDHVPDDFSLIQRTVLRLSRSAEVVLTSGGTGFGARDITPEAVKILFDKEAPGLVAAMLRGGLLKTPLAAMSRPVAGTVGDCLVLTLPGSLKGALENFDAISQVIPHAVRQLGQNSTRELHKLYNNDNDIKHAHSKAVGSESHSHEHKCPHNHEHHGVQHTHAHAGPKFFGPAHRHRTSPYTMISFESAIKKVLDNDCSPRIVKLPLEDAIDHVVAEDIYAPLNVPPFRASIVDGYAILHSESPKVFPLSHVSTASSILATIEPHTCVRITTGAPVPHGATAVVPVENTEVAEASSTGEEISVKIDAMNVKDGDNIRNIGSDIELGELILPKGLYISHLGGEIGLLASIGLSKVTVFTKPVVAVLSTGDEIVPIDQTCYGSQVWDSNRPMLCANLRSWGAKVVDLGISRDNRESIERQLNRGLAEADIVVTTGGVSMGELDLLKPVIEHLGGQIHFGRVAMKPGKPVTYATVRNKPIFALPGNPVSAVVCLNLFVLPLMEKFSGVPPISQRRMKVKLSESIKLDARPEFHRVHVNQIDGEWMAVSTGFQRSSRINSLVSANALLCLPPAAEAQGVLPAGSLVDAIFLNTL